jgi:hypothetical protein
LINYVYIVSQFEIVYKFFDKRSINKVVK